MLFNGVPDLRLRKRQVRHVLKARSGIQSVHVNFCKSTRNHLALQIQSRPTPDATSFQAEFSTSCSVETSTHIKITTYQ